MRKAERVCVCVCVGGLKAGRSGEPAGILNAPCEGTGAEKGDF